ncbi:MAG: molybdopterin converting factor subunit 1 [Pseudomonadota bacterium]
MTLLYFAWVREKVGTGSETIDLPDDVRDVAGLIRWLSARDEGYAAAFEKPELIRVAVDQDHAPHDTPVAGAREIAFFPPVTGG